MPRELLLRPQRLRHRVHDQRRIADRRQPDPEDPGSELAHQLPGRLERQPRLPRSTRAGERHQPRRLVPNERDNLRHFLLAPHERGERHGEVRVRDRPQRRKAIRSELVQRDRLGEVLQPVPAQVEHIVCDQLVGSSREQHLAAVGCAHDPAPPCAHPARRTWADRAAARPYAHRPGSAPARRQATPSPAPPPLPLPTPTRTRRTGRRPRHRPRSPSAHRTPPAKRGGGRPAPPYKPRRRARPAAPSNPRCP